MGILQAPQMFLIWRSTGLDKTLPASWPGSIRLPYLVSTQFLRNSAPLRDPWLAEDAHLSRLPGVILHVPGLFGAIPGSSPFCGGRLQICFLHPDPGRAQDLIYNLQACLAFSALKRLIDCNGAGRAVCLSGSIFQLQIFNFQEFFLILWLVFAIIVFYFREVVASQTL